MLRRSAPLVALGAYVLFATGCAVECEVGDETVVFDSCEDLVEAYSCYEPGADTTAEEATVETEDLRECLNRQCAATYAASGGGSCAP